VSVVAVLVIRPVLVARRVRVVVERLGYLGCGRRRVEASLTLGALSECDDVGSRIWRRLERVVRRVAPIRVVACRSPLVLSACGLCSEASCSSSRSSERISPPYPSLESTAREVVAPGPLGSAPTRPLPRPPRLAVPVRIRIELTKLGDSLPSCVHPFELLRPWL